MSLLTTGPKLDSRTPADIYQACLKAALRTLPEWALRFPTDRYGNLLDPGYFDDTDPGLALFKLFGELFQKLTTPLNGVPGKYALAFWDFMGLTLRAAQAAGAPVAFTSNVDDVVELPQRTQVIGSEIPGIVFETIADLTVLPLSIEAAYAVDPTADAYVDCSRRVGGGGRPFPLFGDDAAHPAQEPFEHALYISDAGFAFGELQGTLSLTFDGSNLYSYYFAVCTDVTGTLLKPKVTAEQNILTVAFAGLPTLPVGEVNGDSRPWLKFAPAPDIRITPVIDDALPNIYAVALTLELSDVAADAAFHNDQEVDLKKGGRPFGAEPAPQDAFYLASEAVFSRTGMMVTLEFSLEALDPPQYVDLAWEFWDGTGWREFPVTDGTACLTQPDPATGTGTVTFTCPQIARTELNNLDNYWIRARIAQGGYGRPAGPVVTVPAKDVVDNIIGPYVTDKDAALALLMQQDINFGFQYQPASYAPPFILALKIGGRLMKLPDRRIQCNGGDYAPLGPRPFLPWPEKAPVFYLGLTIRNYDGAAARRPLTLLFAPDGNDEITFAQPPADGGPAQSGTAAVTPLSLSYWSGTDWQALVPIGDTGQAGSQGILTVRLPASFAPSERFGKKLYWLRVEGPAGLVPPACSMAGIFPNVAAAINAVAYENIVLGSSTGAPDQSFLLPHKPVLEGAVIEVLEPLPPTPPLPEDAPAPEPTDESAKQGWIRWCEVANFDFSTPSSRHYLLDYRTGELTFGNGVAGLVPPEGERNIRAAFYQNGGGALGNVGVGMLNDLQQLTPEIESVRSVADATGGLEADQPQALENRAPGQIRSMDRAVTAADLAVLALAASLEVAQAVCIDDDPSLIRLVILPNGTGQTPQPSFDLRSAVERFVKRRALPLLAPLINAVGPAYTAIDAAFTIVPTEGTTLDAAGTAIESSFAAFLHPLTGGPDGGGWRIGARVDAGAVAAMARACVGVALVRLVTLNGDANGVDLGRDQLPRPGDVTIEPYDADAL